MRYECNSCHARYDDPRPDGTPAFHVCPPDEILAYAIFDDSGKLLKPEKRGPRLNVRNENLRPGLVYIEGKPRLRVQDPEDRTRWVLTEPASLIISEGAGRTEIPESERGDTP